MMENKIEVADGFVSLKEHIWVVHSGFGEFSTDLSHIESVYDDGLHGASAILKINFDGLGSLNVSGYDMKDLKERCFKSYEKAEIKRVELVMCEE